MKMKRKKKEKRGGGAALGYFGTFDHLYHFGIAPYFTVHHVFTETETATERSLSAHILALAFAGTE
jgi:hypothetical protein